MRRITIPEATVELAASTELKGRSVIVPVKLDWPELQLTHDQIVANAVARAEGLPDPHPDLSIVSIELIRPDVVRPSADGVWVKRGEGWFHYSGPGVPA